LSSRCSCRPSWTSCSAFVVPRPHAHPQTARSPARMNPSTSVAVSQMFFGRGGTGGVLGQPLDDQRDDRCQGEQGDVSVVLAAKHGGVADFRGRARKPHGRHLARNSTASSGQAPSRRSALLRQIVQRLRFKRNDDFWTFCSREVWPTAPSRHAVESRRGR